MTNKKEIPSCITASFDPGDEFEMSLAAYVVSKGNRSRYIKRLIYNDMMGVQNQITATTSPVVESEDRAEIEAFF